MIKIFLTVVLLSRNWPCNCDLFQDLNTDNEYGLSVLLWAGGMRDLVWTGVCHWSLETPTHFKGHFGR